MPLMSQHNKYYLLWIFSASRHLSLGTTCHRVTQLLPPPLPTTTTTEGLNESQNGEFFFLYSILWHANNSKKGQERWGGQLGWGSRHDPKVRVFFCFLCFIYLLTIFLGSNYVLNNRGVQWRTATTITGPNDASGVVWALGMFFVIFFVF